MWWNLFLKLLNTREGSISIIQIFFPRQTALIDPERVLELELLRPAVVGSERKEQDLVRFQPQSLSSSKGETRTFPSGVELNFSYKSEGEGITKSEAEARERRDYVERNGIHNVLEDVYSFLLREKPVNVGLATAQYLFATGQYQKTVVAPKEV